MMPLPPTYDGDERGNKSRWGGWLKFDGVSVFAEDTRPRDAQFCEVTVKSGVVEVSNEKELTGVSGGQWCIIVVLSGWPQRRSCLGRRHGKVQPPKIGLRERQRVKVLLNSTQIFERMFIDEFMMDIIGALEYDPEVPHVQHHREFLKEHVVFKEDVVLARILDEATAANLNSMIHANNATIHFLHEFCGLSKSLPMVQQLRRFRDMVNEGIFDTVTDVLQSQDKKLVLTGTDILILFLNQDPNLLRSYVVRQEGVTLLGLLVKGMITDFGDDMHCQFLEILRILLDSCTLSGAQRDTIIDIFYEKHLGQLIKVITASCSPETVANANNKSIDPDQGDQNHSETKPEIMLNICELRCFCVLHHPYRIKCSFLLNNVIDKILLLTRRGEKYLVVGAIRFVRTILSRHVAHTFV
ncbi:hypothetical protein TSUD_397130 [Trifolium subterraneum]|uniref:Serine/threonine-protein phosphatase 4 regulatory subunit 3-like central domain-containing protein n=1 Tax=Trifolium subterraneum TaxID=3900 RepID=A0A2Z6N3Z0_TRISU|nr:hypothetical protein TSUD_397130 [Trifolium subterraneum]